MLTNQAHANDPALINQTVWKMLYGVTDAQINDPNWLVKDDDGDGIRNCDELIAGTNPFSAGSAIKISSISSDSSNVYITFTSILAKQYVVQKSTSLGSSAVWSTLTPSVSAIGTGADITLTAPNIPGVNVFYRVLVQDVDSDGDGVTDWAERTTGYNPNKASTDGTNGDSAAITSALAAENTVTITTTKGTATQPVDSSTPATDLATVTVTRSGNLHFNTITVNLTKAGSATEGTDYTALPGSVTFSPHTNSITLTVVPKAVATRKSNATAIVGLQSGTGYSLGGTTAAAVVINPTIANGTGLTGKYFASSSTTYSPNQTTIFGGTPATTRTEAIDFLSSTWGSPSGVTTTSAFSVRWTGQVLPQYSEKYYFDIRSDDAAKLWVNGVLLVDSWGSSGVTDRVNFINLQAGVLYDIQVDYLNVSGNAEAHLYWWSPSQTKQIIPQNRLFPGPTQANKPTAITSSTDVYGYVSVPFTYTITTPNISGTVSYALESGSAPLPPGLSLNGTTGVISGTPTAAGSYNVAVRANNAAAGTATGGSIINFTIYPTGSVSRELLTAGGSKVSDIVIPTTTPTHDNALSTVDDDSDYANNTGERLRGYIVPPKTGNYYFWLAANNAAELWISNDAEYVNKVRRVSVTSSTGKYTWSSANQSQWLTLTAGQKYYFEVLHNMGADADTYVEMGWCQDDIGTVPAVTGAPNATGTTTLIPSGGGAMQGYPYSGKVPSYLFQPYDYPSLAAISGTLYSANLGPQGSSNTKASGSANLLVAANGASAILHFSYGGLSSPRTAYHLHVDSFGTHPQGEIIYDIDDVDSFHPELRTADGGYIWNFGPVGSFTSAAQILDGIQQGKVYLNIHSVTYPAGEIRGTLTAISGSQLPPVAANYAEPAATDSATNTAHAARFLNQATFGASPSDITAVGSSGFSGWINNQLAVTPSHTSDDVVAGITADINTPYPSTLFTNTWWKKSITAPDQLRQRLAFAMSEIMVVSWNNDTGPLQTNGRILADYYDQLVDYVLPTSGLTNSGTFKGLLKAVTLTPAMGLYLDMRGNQKGDDSLGRHPNENYAREIMQLFSLGIYRQWDDGKFILDSAANLPATYTQPNILGMSALLTGWNYAQANQGNGRAPTNFSPGADYLNPMVLVPSQHDLGAKLLLNNVVTPAATGLTPRVTLSSIAINAGNPCTVNTASDHGLTTGDTVMISNVTGGTFSTPINASFQATVTGSRSFTVPSICSAVPSSYTNAAVTGATVISAPTGTSGLTAVTGSQADNSGTTLPHPYDQYGLTELDTAINNIVANDNVPPYICRQLIQRLVTSDPSPGYLYRVVQKFKDNGSGVRGDLAAVVKQILLDGEARSYSAAAANSSFGKQREPMLRLTGPARAFPAAAYTGTYTQLSGVDSHKLRITTSSPNDFNSGFSISLDFSGNYTTTNPPNPYTNPTSTAYSVASTLGVTSTATDVTSIAPASAGSPITVINTATDISSITPGTGATTIITTTQPHGLGSSGTKTVWIFGACGTFSSTINAASLTATLTGPNTFTVPITTTRTFQVTNISLGSPCTITTAAPHGLTTGNTVTINGITGGTFSPAINGNFPVTVTGANTFTVASNCTVVPTGYPSMRETSNPCRVTTSAPHGLTTGDVVTISGVTGGSFTPTINGTFSVTVVDSTSFTVASSAASPATGYSGAQSISQNSLITTAQPHGLATGAKVWLTGACGIFGATANGTQLNATVTGPNTFTVGLQTGGTFAISSISTGSPCTITTTAPHGLTTGNTVTINGVTGGTFSPTINGSFTNITVTGANTFTVASNCTVVPTGYPLLRETSNPCRITTLLPHGLSVGNTVTISGVSGGSFTPAINGTFDVVSVPDATSFTVASACSSPGTTFTSAQVVGANTLDVASTGMVNVAYSQTAGSSTMTVSTGGPATDVSVPGTVTTIKSRVYLKFLTQTTAGGAAIPADGIYDVQSPATPGSTFTVFTADTPATGRTGNVIIPKISSSYTPQSSNTIVQFNTNVNHNFNPGALNTQHVWVDAPVVTSPLTDAEYVVTAISDEDHFQTSYLPFNLNGGTYPKPSGSNNGVTLWPLVPPPLGRSGSVKINTSTFNLGSTESTLTQSPLNSPTVFNFFFPNYKYPGTLANSGLDSPEFQLTTDTNVANLTSSIVNMFIGTGGGNSNVNGLSSFNNGGGAVVMDIGQYMTDGQVSNAGIPTLVDNLANLLVGAPLDTSTRTTIINFVANNTNFPLGSPTTGTQRRDRVRAIIHLIITSAEYAVQK